MGRQVGWARRLGILLRWPAGMAFTSWRYLWRTTPLHRLDELGSPEDCGPVISSALRDNRLQAVEDGIGPVYLRLYRVTIEQPKLSARELIDRIAQDPNKPAPVEVATFRKTAGDTARLAPGDEFVVRMPGPWDGPVRVVDRGPTSYRFATLRGHLEAGQIEFRARDDGEVLNFEIESWTTAGDRLSHFLYSRVRLVKEMQLHMWTHYCERAGKLSGGRLRDGVHVRTRRYEGPLGGRSCEPQSSS
jgi:hypothetical protein